MNKALYLGLLPLLLLASSRVSIAQEQKPDRRAFLLEVIDAQPTTLTPQFNDYVEGNYHVNKQEILDYLPGIAKEKNKNLQGLLIVGPTGPLWTYFVITFFEEGEGQIRVNAVMMPHARITNKSSALITTNRYVEFLDELSKSGILQTELPAEARASKNKKASEFDFKYDVLLFNPKPNTPKGSIYYGDVARNKDRKKREAFGASVNKLLKELKSTYSHSSLGH
jgi:hypothetical protein